MVRAGWIWVAGSLALTILAACGEPPEVKADVSPRVAGSALIVKEEPVPDYRLAAAILTNRDIGDARARIGGVLTQIVVREGENVRPGQLLAVIADERVTLEARAGLALVAASEAGAVKARQDLARAERLFAGEAISASGLDAARAQAHAAEAQLNAARAQAGAAQAVSDSGMIRAPAAGQVTRLPYPRGAVIAQGDVVAEVSVGEPVLRIELPESEAAHLQEGAFIRLTSDLEGAPVVSAVIRQVYPSVRGGQVTADLEAPEPHVGLLGSRIRVLVPAGVRQAIVIPSAYLASRFGADYVRLETQDGGVIDAPVQRGLLSPTSERPDAVEILSGLRAGDRILPQDTRP